MTRDLPFDGDDDDAGERTGDTAYQVANGVARVARAGAYVTGGALVAANGGGVPAAPGSAKLDSWNAGWARASDPDPDVPSPVVTFPDPDPNNLPPALPGTHTPVNQGVQLPDLGARPLPDLPTWRDGIPGNNEPVHPNLQINPNFRDGVPGNNQAPPGWNDGIPGNNAPVHPNQGGQFGHQPPSGQFGIPGYEPPRVPDWREGLPGFGGPRQRGEDENDEGQPGFGLPGHGGNGFGLPGTEGLVPPGSNPFVIPRIPAAGKTESVADRDESEEPGSHSSGNPFDVMDHNPFYATGNPFDGVGTPFQGGNSYDPTGHAFDGVGGGDFGVFVGVEAGASLVTDFDVEFGVTPEGMYFYTDLKVEATAGIKVVTAAGNNVGDQVDKFNDWLDSGGKLPGARNGLDHGNGGSGALGGSHAGPGPQLGTGIAPQPAPMPAPAPMPVVAAPVVPVVAPAVVAPAPAVAQPALSTPLQTTIQPDAATTPIAHTFDAPIGGSPLTAPAAAVPALFEQPTKHTVVVPPQTDYPGDHSTGTPVTIPTTVTTSIPTHTAGPTIPDATKTPDGVTKVPGATVTPTLPDLTITKVPGATQTGTPSTGGATHTGTPSTSNGGATTGVPTQTGTPSDDVTLPGTTAGGASSTPSIPTTQPSVEVPTTVEVPTVEPSVDVPTVEPTVSIPVVTPSVTHSAPALTTMPTVPTFDTDPSIPTMDIEVPTNDIPLPTQPMPTIPVKPIAAEMQPLHSGDHGLVYYPDAAMYLAPGTDHAALMATGLSAALQPETTLLAETHHPVSTGHDLPLMM